ncbi:hypothetical protein SAMN06265337_3018 [Hymenobacter gelipurpurascens]|uniref:DUF4177 domain-containing protein n=1 Tax=Hymenobacter gelipurpurascens TaxID=89968 RepID=A0A212UCE8_9BACT|nr:hypothetical protein [Hymenobacter gelipurpurascens]SNC75714.1 hypothetical protein SAMN06265337_3018 [Hymenobacter gelipurpurascens]
MKFPLRLCLFLPAILGLRMAAAQQGPPASKTQPSPLAPLPEMALQPTMTTSVLPAAGGLRYRYQQVRAYNDECVYLAPAWHGQSKLQPRKQSLFAGPDRAELDALLLSTLNELAEDGWELVEIQSSALPIRATQKVETELAYNDPNRPVYTGTTSIETRTQTRYLFRKPLPNQR